MRIAIVNDMPMAVECLRRVIVGTDLHTVAWTAFNGRDAIDECSKDVPDLVLMDIIMPDINGVETTREIMRVSPCPILLVTSSVDKNFALVFEAMGYGALDAINTPVLLGKESHQAENPLLKKISMLNILTQPILQSVSTEYKPTNMGASISHARSIVTIGSSSGGPQALATILKSLPHDFSVPVVIIQHVDSQFATGLAEWLSSVSNIPVRIAQSGNKPSVGTIFLAGSDDHLLLGEDGCFIYSSTPEDTPYRPSVDVFWHSLEKNWDGQVMALLLTGMGRDGAKAMLSLREHGAYTLAQDEQSCAVYGMPKAAVDIGAASDILPIDKIAQLLIKKTMKAH